MIARYLIEDNETEVIELDYDRTCQSTKIKTKFKKLIGNYTLHSKEHETNLYDEAQRVILSNFWNNWIFWKDSV